MIYDADPYISTPLALHAFRRIQWNEGSKQFDANPVGVGITRVPLAGITALLEDLDATGRSDHDMDTSDHADDRKNGTSQPSTASILGWDVLRDEIDEDAAAITLAQVQLEDGDLLDCVVKPDPSLASAPKAARSIGRDRPSDRFSHSRR